MAAADFYETLGVDRNATDDQIRKAYRKLARKYHPDVNPGDKTAEKKFKDISEAYGILSDPKRRAQYDQFGNAAFGGTEGGPGSPGGPMEGFDFSEMFGGAGAGGGGFDIFETLFGGGMRGGRASRRPGPQRGQDIYATLNLTFDDAFRGVTKDVTIDGAETCHACGGTGTDPASRPEKCPTCRGRGTIETNRGFLKLNQTCRACGGSGTKPGKSCSTCGGVGYQNATKRLSVKIPPGVDNGSKIRLAGKGQPGGPGAPMGDLYIVTQIEPSPRFERKGNNLYSDAPITIVEAALGTSIEVPTPEGKASLRIPPGTDSGKTFRLRGRGFPSLQGIGRGDLFVRVHIVAPKNLNAESRRILEDFARSNRDDPRAFR